MEALNRIIAVGLTTFRETIRNRVLIHLLGFAVAMMAVGWVVSNWSLGEPERIVADIGLSVAVFAGCAIALFSGVALVWGEVERRTILPILAKPLRRSEYITGKFLGFSTAVAIVYLGMNAILLLFFLAVAAPVTGGVITAMFLGLWEVLIVVALALLFSSFSTPTLSALYTAMIFIAGRFSGDILIYIEANPLARAKPLLEAIYALLPRLTYFDVRLEAVYGLPIEAGETLLSSIYAAAYIFVLLVAAIWIFRSRDVA